MCIVSVVRSDSSLHVQNPSTRCVALCRGGESLLGLEVSAGCIDVVVVECDLGCAQREVPHERMFLSDRDFGLRDRGLGELLSLLCVATANPDVLGSVVVDDRAKEVGRGEGCSRASCGFEVRLRLVAPADVHVVRAHG